MLPIIASDEDRQSPAVEIKGNFVNFRELMVWAQRGRQFVVFENRDVEQILEARLEMAVEIGVFENAIRVFAIYVETALQNNPILRQRAGLIRA